MSTPVKSVSFIHPVSLGGSIKSASMFSPSAPERPGSAPFDLSLVEVGGFPFVRVGRSQNGQLRFKCVPLTNVADLEEMSQEDIAALAAKKKTEADAKKQVAKS